MGLFKAVGLAVASRINDSITQRETRKAKQIAYESTGKKLQRAKKRGRFVDGKDAYHRELRKQMVDVNKGHQRRTDFSNNLFD